MRKSLLLIGMLVICAALAQPRSDVQGRSDATDAFVCESGFAGPYSCENVDLLAHLTVPEMGGPPEDGANNLWGWTDPESGKEYVLFGMTDATAFVDISDPENPIYLGSLPGRGVPAQRYRDMKVYHNYAFVIADVPSANGLQVFDLTELRDVISPTVTFTDTAHLPDLGNSHNFFINEETGYAYVATRSALCNGALQIIDVNDPLNPTLAGCAAEAGGAASDTMCVIYEGMDHEHHGKEICITSSDDNLIVSDVTDKNAPVNLDSPLTYPNIARAHHGWWTEDHRYFLSADMEDEHHYGGFSRTFIWDLADLDAPVLLNIYEGPTFAQDHNIWVHDGQAYIGNFRAGLRILDISHIASGDLRETAYFDSYAADDNVGHEGSWAVYPYFESGVIAVSDKDEGLYLLRQRWPAFLPSVVGP